MEVPDRDKLVYQRMQAGATEPKVERLLPPPEAPIPRPAAPPAPMAAKPQPLSPVAKPQPAPPPAPEPSLAKASPPQPSVAKVPPKPKAPPVAEGYLVQLLAARSRGAAEGEWKRLRDRHRALLGRLSPSVVRADLGHEKGIYYRLRAGPLGNEAAARALCAELKARKVTCSSSAPGARDLSMKAMIVGCCGPAPTPARRVSSPPPILMGSSCSERNCQDPEQVRGLVAALRDSVGRADAPVLIDQEGAGWRASSRPIGAAIRRRRFRPHGRARRAAEAARLNARLIAAALADLDITIDCTPVLDVPSRAPMR